MRVSMREGDAGYRADTRKVEVYVDGEKIKWCHTADEELGIAIVHKVGDGRVDDETITGKVEIRIRP